MMIGAARVEVGFYGKLPSHGDFLRRRVSDAFVGVWDDWLQECLAVSRSALGDRWLDVYLTSPAWRFACGPGVFGPQPTIGLMVPSVDRVGRYFHLTFVAAMPEHVSVIAAAMGAESFLDRAEQLAVETLAAERIDFESFDRSVSELAYELEAVTAPQPLVLEPTAAAVLRDDASASWRIPMGTPPQLAPVLQQLIAQRLATLYDPLVLWWTDGSEHVEPSCLIGRGLPASEAFGAMLDGAWTPRRWESIPARIESEPTAADDVLAIDPTPPQFRSAGATDVGRVRSINQDSFLERPEVGLWVVADGLGGHSNGEVASRMVCDALADFVPGASFEEMVEAASQRVQDVNTALVRAAERTDNVVRAGSTVVALLTRGTRYAVLWAGDSRVYLMRDNRLEQLTRDHSAEEQDASGHSSSAITRAVGGEATLMLDGCRGRVRAGDRLLLCSDGLTRTLSHVRIEEWLRHPDLRACVDGLITSTLEAGAPDNVTVVVVEAYS
jgi:type VI secretion system protein ImpM